MTELFENIVRVLASEQSSRALADEFRIESAEAAGSAAELCIPVVLVNLSRVANDPITIGPLMSALRSVETAGLATPGPTIQAGLYEPFGSELVQILLGSRREKVAGVVAAGAGISERSAQWLLSPVAWAVMASIAERYGNRLAEQSLIAILKQEYLALLDGGWEPWLEATGDTAIAANTDEHRAIQAAAQDTAAERIQTFSKYPPPVRRDQRFSSELEGSRDAGHNQPHVDSTSGITYGSDEASEGSSASQDDPSIQHGGTSQRLGPKARPNQGVGVAEAEQRGTRLPIVFGVVVAAALGALLWLFLFRNEAPDLEAIASTDEAEESTEETSTTVAPASAEIDDDNASNDDNTVADGETNDGIVQIDVLMSDPLGRTEATGIAEIRLDADKGEICYNVTSDGLEAPYDTHIHIGPADVKGPIVVDFGARNSGDIGCITVPATEIDAIIADRSGHYYELHEPEGEITIRAQLSEVVEEKATPTNQFDPTGGGARAVIEAGRITLRGDVADQATVDFLMQEFSTVDSNETELVNELRIVPNSPAPSGLIEVNDEILFAVASAELDSVEGSVIEDLANLFRARPDWTMAVVGHTDNTGAPVDNLELSLRRADAVRDALIELGVDGENLRTQGAGDTQPIFSNQTENGRARNRRIEFRVDPPSR